ncbi:MAG: ADP-ribose diphosphatase [Alphaproteobacteria bacterium CG_4_10_14_0_2_um_filter_63_37]|nr:MAG: ADP-ribose diphosphatase [Proteobacteria bacterium CG1_02_64_396]PJA24836.1 MAG: ADP-ribose diphosphatase [Alphaproteobacteria bacterium CG_4_10_14_0_2_um_filter_63_37]
MSESQSSKQVEILGREVCFQGFFRMERFRLRHTLFAGGWSPVVERELFERGHAAALLPYDPVRDEVVLIEQFRIGALEAPGGAWLLEIVAGIIELGETPEEVVRRETVEEAGIEVAEVEPIYDYLVSPGGTSERITLLCGRVDASRAQGIHGLPHEGEDIRVLAVPFTTAWRWLEEGRIDNATPIVALQWLALNRKRLRLKWGVTPGV